MIVTARLARTGAQDYGDHVEQRDSSEVFAPASLATYRGAPVTRGHTFIKSPDDARTFAIGYVRSVSRDAGHNAPRSNQHDPTGGSSYEFVVGELVITDAQAAEDIRAGKLVEVSAGYAVDLADDGYVAAGDRPVFRQTNIRINHVAFGPRDFARCGAACAIT